MLAFLYARATSGTVPHSFVCRFLTLFISSFSELTAPINILLEILSKWPRYFSQGPAAEMWSVVHFPFTWSRQTGNKRTQYFCNQTPHQNLTTHQKLDTSPPSYSVLVPVFLPQCNMKHEDDLSWCGLRQLKKKKLYSAMCCNYVAT